MRQEMVTRPTADLWERLITQRLEHIDPIRSRWLQEHPNRTVVLHELIAEADAALDDMRDPLRERQRSFLHRSIPAADRPPEVVATMLDSVELWSMVTERSPNPPAMPGRPQTVSGRET